MALNITHFMGWKDCYDFLSEPHSYVILYDLSSTQILMVMKLLADELFVREIIKDAVTGKFCLDYTTDWFFDLEALIDHENYMYEWSFSTVKRLKLGRPV